MKKRLFFILLLIMLTLSVIQPATATSVFLTSDHIGSQNNDLEMLNSVKEYLEELSDGQLDVYIDSYAPCPGEGTRAIEANADVSVNFAASDGGNFLILAKAMQNINKQIIFVNTGNFDLDENNYIRRAWDDNYSSDYFAGINSPGTFLQSSQIEYIQPLKEFPNAGETYTSSDDEINKYIAQEILQKINNQNTNNYYDESLIVTHNMHPSKMAHASKQLVQSEDTTYNGTYDNYNAAQILYMTSSYLNGNGLEEPAYYDIPDSPLETSVMARSSYSVYDYMKMGSIVKTFMDENKRAPNYIKYEGAYLAYPDVLYNFARITENHTDSNHMDFASAYRFDKVNHSILTDYLLFVLLIPAIIIIVGVIRRIRKLKRRNRRRRY